MGTRTHPIPSHTNYTGYEGSGAASSCSCSSSDNSDNDNDNDDDCRGCGSVVFPSPALGLYPYPNPCKVSCITRRMIRWSHPYLVQIYVQPTEFCGQRKLLAFRD